MSETRLRSQRVKAPLVQRLATGTEPSLAAVRAIGRLMRRQEVYEPMETSLENFNIVGKAEAFISAKGSIGTTDRARSYDPPGCVTSARTQGIGGNLGDPWSPRAGQTAERGRDKQGRLERDPKGTGGVGWASTTEEAGEAAGAVTPWREGADRGFRKKAMNNASSEGNILGTRRPV
jgi:hypothetical protein